MAAEKYSFTDVSPDIPLKEFFNDNEHFAELFNSYLFRGENIVIPEELQDMNPEVSSSIFGKEFQKTIKRARDVLKVSQTGEYYRILGIENQQAIHYAMPLRIMIYDALTYLQEMKKITAVRKKESDFANVEEFLSGCKKEDKLHPCYTIVIYFGEKKWDGPRDLAEMMDIKSDDPMKKYFSNYPMYLLCINELEKIPKETGEVSQLFTAIHGTYKTGGRDLPKVLSKVNLYIAYITALVTKTTDEYAEILTEAMQNGEESINMCEAAEKAFRATREEGRAEGIAEGIAEGRAEGIAEGRAEGIAEGRAEGIELTLKNNAIEMLRLGIPEEQILQITKFSKDQLEELKKNI